MTDLIPHEPRAVQQRSFFTMEPEDQIVYASKIAKSLGDVIEKQKLFSVITGKKYIKVEGWQTLGTFLGITARENRVIQLDDGSYEAFVDLIKFSDGTVVGGASALCSVAEKRWGAADAFARRSMAITRATGKAYRCAFAWIVTLAGYQPTPAEEMPDAEGSSSEIYTGTGTQQSKVAKEALKAELDKKLWPALDLELMNKPMDSFHISAAISKIKRDQHA